MRRSASFALVLLASACTVGPNYKEPAAPVPQVYAGPQVAGGDPQGLDLVCWWQAFGDPELTRLIEIGLKQAPDLQTAESRVREARFQVIATRSAGLPSVDATGSAEDIYLKQFGHSDIGKFIQQYTDQSGSGASGTGTTTSMGTGTTGTAGGSQPSIPHNISLFSAGFDASWELDIFGGVRRQVEAARAQEAAARWNARDARVSLAAEIASDYLQMRGYQAQARIQATEADRQARALSILEHTAHVGLVPQGNAIQQRTQLAQARAQIAPLQAQGFLMMHAIAVLIGEQPETLIPELNTNVALPPVPPQIPPGLPIDLIRRRPDVRAAERQLAAATADIGVAVADLYPKVSLSVMPQLATGFLGGFFIGKSLQLTSQGQISFPIFDFGARRATIGARREEREQAYIQWRKTVLGALRDVEDALTNIQSTRIARQQLIGGVADAQRSLATVEAQFQVGLQNYTPVLNGQQTLLQSQNSLVQNEVRLRTDIAAYYKALGGGWSQDDASPDRPVIEDQPKTR